MKRIAQAGENVPVTPDHVRINVNILNTYLYLPNQLSARKAPINGVVYTNNNIVWKIAVPISSDQPKYDVR